MNLIDDDIVRDFLAEASERLDQLEQDLLEQESSETIDPEVVTRMFRMAHSIKGASASLGFRSLTDLTHGVESLLVKLRDAKLDWNPAIPQVLLASVDAIRAILANLEQDESTDVSEPCRQLEKACDRTLETSALPSRTTRARVTAEREPSTAGDSPGKIDARSTNGHTPKARKGHADESLYLISLLRSHRLQMEPQDGWFFGQLARLASVLRSGRVQGRFAAEVLDVLRGHDFFSSVERVCLAKVVGCANQLMVIDSANTGDEQRNLMKPGYRCFVSPNSSLFQVPEGNYRVFNDSKSVVRSFEADDKPVQRSIGLISAMGYASGLCLPIFTHSRPEGFLFLNARPAGAFAKMPDRCLPTLVILETFAKAALLIYQPIIRSEVHASEDLELLAFRGTAFHREQFTSLLRRLLRRQSSAPPEIRIVQAKGIHFLYSPGHVAALLARILVCLRLTRDDAPEIAIRFERVGQHVRCRLPHLHPTASNTDLENLRTHLRLAEFECASLGFAFDVDESEVQFEFPADEPDHLHPEIRYSVLKQDTSPLAV